jgi:hypothetical protein
MKKIILFAVRLAAALTLLQILYFKFTGHPESVELFTKPGVEPWGRIGIGIIELLTGVLLLIRPTFLLGSVMGIGLMIGAISSHFLVLEVK